MNVYCSKIPMTWVETKTGKCKFTEWKNAKDPKGTIYYGLRQTRPEGFVLSDAFDKALIEAIRKVGGIKSNMIVVKDINVSYSGKQWMKPSDGCEVIVIDGLTKKPTFRQVVNGTDDYSSVKKQPEQEAQGSMVDDIIEEAMGKLPDGSGFMTGTIKEDCDNDMGIPTTGQDLNLVTGTTLGENAYEGDDRVDTSGSTVGKFEQVIEEELMTEEPFMQRGKPFMNQGDSFYKKGSWWESKGSVTASIMKEYYGTDGNWEDPEADAQLKSMYDYSRQNKKLRLRETQT